MASRPTCETCRFLGGVGAFYDCRRHAPITFREWGGVMQARWPQVEGHHWCGDHEPRAAASARPVQAPSSAIERAILCLESAAAFNPDNARNYEGAAAGLRALNAGANGSA
jgi:hypothetical protein